MTQLSQGETWYCPISDRVFTVQESVNTLGMSTMEMDQISVKIRFEDGDVQYVPHERFRGRRTYEKR